MKYIEPIILILFALLLSYYGTSYLYSKYKGHVVISEKNSFLTSILSFTKKSYHSSGRWLFFIQYVVSTFSFIILFIRYHNILLSIVFFVLFYTLSPIIIYTRKKKKSAVFVYQLEHIAQMLSLNISCNMPLYKSLQLSFRTVDNKQLSDILNKLVNDYILYNFSMIKAVQAIKEKELPVELTMFFNLLIESETTGDLNSSLAVFLDTLNLGYFKYWKIKESKRAAMVIFSCLLVLINLMVTVLYPITTQISQNLDQILK